MMLKSLIHSIISKKYNKSFTSPRKLSRAKRGIGYLSMEPLCWTKDSFFLYPWLEQNESTREELIAQQDGIKYLPKNTALSATWIQDFGELASLKK